jgi:hypothetical protein
MHPLHPGHRFAIAACVLGSFTLASCGDAGPTAPTDRTLEVEMKVVAITLVAADKQLGLNGNADFDPGEHDIVIGGAGCRLRATISVAAKERS